MLYIDLRRGTYPYGITNNESIDPSCEAVSASVDYTDTRAAAYLPSIAEVSTNLQSRTLRAISNR